jgi:RNA polymerase sigma factor FliA
MSTAFHVQPEDHSNDVAFAMAIARDMKRRLPASVDVGDVTGPALEAVVDARRRYDPSRGVSFRTFARHRVRGAILDELRACAFVPTSVRRRADRIERARNALVAELGREPSEIELAGRLEITVSDLTSWRRRAEIRVVVSLDDQVGDTDMRISDEVADTGPDVVALMADVELKNALREAIAELPERERTALVLFHFKKVQLKEVGAILGVSESRACQLCGQAIKRLRAVMTAR